MVQELCDCHIEICPQSCFCLVGQLLPAFEIFVSQSDRNNVLCWDSFFPFLKDMKALKVRHERYLSASSSSSFCMIPSMLTMSLSRLRCLPAYTRTHTVAQKYGKTVNIFTKFTFRGSLEDGRLHRFRVWVFRLTWMNMNQTFSKCLVKHSVQCKLVQPHATCSQDRHQDDNQEEKEDADQDADHQEPLLLNVIAVYTRRGLVSTEEY